MRIDSSEIGMESARSYSAQTAKTVRYYRGSAKSLTAGGGNGFLGGFWEMNEEEETENTNASGNAQAGLQDISLHFRNLSNMNRLDTGSEEKKAIEKIRQSCMNFLMYILFGDRYKRRYDWEEGMNGSGNAIYGLSSGENAVTYSNQYMHYESETTDFSAKGVVKTADGRQISFGIGLEMSRSFTQYYEENYDLSVLKHDYTDPLVINLDSNIAGLSDQKFFFDLDCDGSKEEISALNKGSGYLALDLNGDGIINDGSELFGARSGDGFADLAKYDSDKDGWIDEDDEVWDKLLIWCKDEDGKDKLYTLAQAGVGAVCLQEASTQFSLNSMRDNSNNGLIRSTGIFLYENGNVGTVQHLDLAQ